jgi:hypothetical protein
VLGWLRAHCKEKATSPGPPSPKKKYEFRASQTWAAGIADLPSERLDDGATVVLYGLCPDCKHEMSVELPILLQTGSLRVTADLDDQSLVEGGDSRAFRRIARCNCQMAHEERAADVKEGCGSYGALDVGGSREAGVGRKHVSVRAAKRPATIGDAKWEERADTLSFNALSNVRSTAEKWTTTIASVLAIFSVVALVKGPEDVTKVEGDFGPFANETWAVIFIGGAVICAAVATILAANAAYGLPGRFRFTGENVRELHRVDTAKSALALAWARFLSFGAVGFLMLAVAITWLATPEKPEPASSVLVVREVGRPFCGVLQASAPGTIGVLEKGSKTPRVVGVDEVVALTAVAACPGES